MEPNTARDPLSGAWVVGFNKNLFPSHRAYGPYAGRPGTVRFSPVKGQAVQAVQRAPPPIKLSRKKSNVLSDSDDESSDSDGHWGSDGELQGKRVGCSLEGRLVKAKSRWEDELLAHLLLPASPLKTGSA